MTESLLLLIILSLFLRSSSFSVSGKSVAILQSKGGGHGEIGYALAKKLMADNEVTILQDPACKRTTEPFCSYDADLISNGVKIMDCDLSNTVSVSSSLASNAWNVVIDNNSKDKTFVSELATLITTDQFFYVSSGGMYKECPEGGCCESTTPVKEDNACREVEVALFDGPLADKITIFRPQYIYGDNTNKRSNVDWFVDRVIRDVTIPLPGDGSQLVGLSHVDDVAELMCSAIGKEAGIYNCGTDIMVSYKDVVYEVAKALGKGVDSVKISSYDPKALNKELGKPSFPLRPTTFVVNPTKAKNVLGWTGAKHTLSKDLPKWIEQYKKFGLDKKDFKEDAVVEEFV
jgi:nucleoside-diphosphate-sugar epimerase